MKKWFVGGQYGGEFSNLKDAKKCAREASKTPEYNFKAKIMHRVNCHCYFEYENGKCILDEWTNQPTMVS